jgi:protein phosphatase 2C family protein 2/3
VARQELSAICENLMDNCLARTSDTGGVGCDNMTVIIIGLLKGKTQEQWYDEIAARVANGDGPCAPPEFGALLHLATAKLTRTAEHRGPGAHHGQNFEENRDDYDMPMELDSRSAASNFSRLSRGIILLGDGSNFGIPGSAADGSGIRIATADDIDMMDHDEEDRDLEAQVARHTPPSGSEEDEPVADGERSRREETPGPQAAADTLPSRAHVDTSAAKEPEQPKAEPKATPSEAAATEKPKEAESKA